MVEVEWLVRWISEYGYATLYMTDTRNRITEDQRPSPVFSDYSFRSLQQPFPPSLSRKPTQDGGTGPPPKDVTHAEPGDHPHMSDKKSGKGHTDNPQPQTEKRTSGRGWPDCRRVFKPGGGGLRVRDK